MVKIGFDSQKYIQLQSAKIRERIAQFGGKLYLEFGGKLFDDYHASRVLPGFQPDNKIRMLMELKDQAEIVIAINANDIEKSKKRGDLNITYDVDVIRLVDIFREFGLYVGSICLTQYSGQPSAEIFEAKMKKLGLEVYRSTTSVIIPPTSRSSSATTASAATITSAPAVPWWWSPLPARAAARWPPAFPSSIMSTSTA